MQSNASKVISWLGANRDYILIVCLALLLTSYIFSSESIIGKNADVNEIYHFLERDLTDERMYIDNIYDCEYFAKDVQYNANTLGIRCAVVLIVSNRVNVKGQIIVFMLLSVSMLMAPRFILTRKMIDKCIQKSI